MSPAMPHCDARILHAPGVCTYCDKHPEWQEYRLAAGICFTGETPENSWQTPCPADQARPPDSPSDHRKWGANKPTSADGDPTWPEETPTSVAMYGDKGGRGWTRAIMEKFMRQI